MFWSFFWMILKMMSPIQEKIAKKMVKKDDQKDCKKDSVFSWEKCVKTAFFACLLLVKLHNSFRSRSNFDLSVTHRQTHTHTQTDTRTSSNLRLTYTKGPSGKYSVLCLSTTTSSKTTLESVIWGLGSQIVFAGAWKLSQNTIMWRDPRKIFHFLKIYY